MHDYQMPLVLFTVMSQWDRCRTCLISLSMANTKLRHVKPQSVTYNDCPYLVN